MKYTKKNCPAVTMTDGEFRKVWDDFESGRKKGSLRRALGRLPRFTTTGFAGFHYYEKRAEV